MNLDNIFKAKWGPVPVWIVLVLGVAGAWTGYRYYKSKQGGNGNQSTDPTNPFAPASGQGTFNSTVNGGDGTSASLNTNGPLLSSGGVGYGYPGYPGAAPGGDIYVNIPGSPTQTTTQTVAQQTYTVKQGDTLQKIARRIWGASSLWRQIYQGNITAIGNNPNKISVGDVLTIPTLTQDAISAGVSQDASSEPQHKSNNDQHQHSGGRRR